MFALVNLVIYLGNLLGMCRDDLSDRVERRTYEYEAAIQLACPDSTFLPKSLLKVRPPLRVMKLDTNWMLGVSYSVRCCRLSSDCPRYWLVEQGDDHTWMRLAVTNSEIIANRVVWLTGDVITGSMARKTRAWSGVSANVWASLLVVGLMASVVRGG